MLDFVVLQTVYTYFIYHLNDLSWDFRLTTCLPLSPALPPTTPAVTFFPLSILVV